MQELKNIDTVVLLIIVAAHSSYYGRVLTVGEVKDCEITICQLKEEISSWKEAQKKLLLNLSRIVITKLNGLIINPVA